jgi:hypothetical protein
MRHSYRRQPGKMRIRVRWMRVIRMQGAVCRMQGVVERRCVWTGQFRSYWPCRACPLLLLPPLPLLVSHARAGAFARLSNTFLPVQALSKRIHTINLHASQDLSHYYLTRQVHPLHCTSLVALASARHHTRAAIAHQNVRPSPHRPQRPSTSRSPRRSHQRYSARR